MLETILALPTPGKQSKRLIEDNLIKKQMDSQLGEYQSELHLSRAKWTTSLTRIFADLLVEQILQGNRPNNTFSKKAWTHVCNEFNKQTGLNFDRKQLKNHIDVLRKGYNNVKSLLEQSGFSWDESRCMVKADDEVWIRYIEAHPEAETIRSKGCPIFKQLRRIFSESGDDMRDSLSDLQPATHQMDSQPYQPQSKQNQSKAKWTTSLDKIFTNLMVEQILEGNMSNNIFTKKAWKYICDEFNKQTGLNFNKKQLKNHHNVLRRLYKSLKLLLDQNSFSWDETQCMVTAEDEVWKKYIRAHPEAETIRTNGCPIYKQLQRIFSESGLDGESVLSDSETAVQQMDSPPNEQQQSKQDPSKAKWTTCLDNILMDLLIEHKQVNKSTSVCYKKVWKYICDEFNKQTGMKFDEQQLRNHYSVLRRRFNNVKALLGQSDFDWDESRCMIMGKDEVWDNYIKAHPEAEAIRMKGCPIYKRLCTLFSESGVGRKIHDLEFDEERARTETPHSSAYPETASVSDMREARLKSVQDEASSHSREYVNISDARNKRRLVSPSNRDCYKRICEVVDHVLTDDVLLETASTSRIRTTALPQSCHRFSISNCVRMLNEMQGVDQHLYLAALDVFEDANRRETFISIKSDIRMAWLKGKCKVPS